MASASVQEVSDRLRARGIEISIGGCGCCGSPYVRLTIDGEDIVGSADDYEDEFKIFMHKKEDS